MSADRPLPRGLYRRFFVLDLAQSEAVYDVFAPDRGDALRQVERRLVGGLLPSHRDVAVWQEGRRDVLRAVLRAVGPASGPILVTRLLIPAPGPNRFRIVDLETVEPSR